MHLAIGILGIALIAIVLWDAFEAIILPRRVTRRVRLTRLFYRATWQPWSAIVRWVHQSKRRERLLAFFGPLSLLMLLVVWAVSLVLGFAMIQWAAGSNLSSPSGPADFWMDLYLSGTTIFTLGLGDVVPMDPLARALVVVEAGVGLGLLALVIGYLPVLYQAFSRREVHIAMLDARAGTPPVAIRLLGKHREAENMIALDNLLRDWEHWASDLLESHLSYPVLCFFRSQHDNQSWVAALTSILDACSLIMVGIDGATKWQAELTFKMARHAVVDIAQVFNTKPLKDDGDRLSIGDLAQVRKALSVSGAHLSNDPGDDQALADLRAMYEPYVKVLSRYLMMPLPPWLPKPKAVDNWQTSAWEINPADTERPIRKCMLAHPPVKAVVLAKTSAETSD